CGSMAREQRGPLGRAVSRACAIVSAVVMTPPLDACSPRLRSRPYRQGRPMTSRADAGPRCSADAGAFAALNTPCVHARRSPQVQVLEEVGPLVVDHDEGWVILDLDGPD